MLTLRYVQVPFNTIEGRRKPKVAEWLTFTRNCVPYSFTDCVPKRPRKAFYAMVDVLNELLDQTADYDCHTDNRFEELKAVRDRVTRALVLFENAFPHSEMTPCIHWILHFPDFIARWNNVRNFWCFLTERFVGWMKTFVKNRTLAVENMVR